MRGLDILRGAKDPNKIESSVGQIMKTTYDDKFKNPFNNVFENYEAREHINPGIDYSNRDYLSGFEDPFKQDIEELRAQRQPWGTKVIAGSGRVVSKAATEIFKIPIVAGGMIGGAIGQIADLVTGEDNTDFMSVAFDNAWIRSINDINEWVNDEVLPVYVRKAVSEGNLWDNITSIDFYATDGADGLGYIFAMLAPGAALSRLKLGSKVFGTVGDLSGISKGMKFSDEALTNMQKMAKLGLPTNAKNFDLYSQTIANTIIEAGAESQQAGQQYEEENLWKTELSPDDPAYMSLEELNQNKSNIMANIFKGNAVVLIGPNAIMSKMLWGGARNSTRGLKNFKFEGGAIKQIEKKGALQTTKEIVQEFGKAGLREGFWEEGMQSATSDFFSANPEAGFLSSIGEIPQAYADMITSVEGQKAIYLGGLLGGGIQSITNFNQSKKERENTNKLISYANNSLENYWKTFEGDIYKKDENGEVIKDESSKPELDEKVAIERLQRLSQLEQLSDVYDQALADGNGELASQLRNEATISFIADFLNNDALGIETLQQYLQTSPGVETMAQNEGVSKESIISDIMDMAKSLELANQTFDNFSDTLLDVKNDKATKEDTQTFFQGLRDKYFAIKARRHFVTKRLESLDNQLNNLIKEKGRTREQYDNNGKLAIELNNTDARFKSVNDKINNYKEAEEELTNIENDFWNKKAVQKEFDSKVNLWDKIRTEAEAKAQEVTEVMDKINNATTEEELDDISKTNTFADKVINDAIVKKRQELQAEKEAKKQAKTDEQQKQSEANEQANAKTQEAKEDLGDKIDGYNTGEEFSLTKAELLPYIDNLDQNEYTGIIESAENNTEDSVTIRIQETGEEITIPKKVSKPQPTNLEQEFGTEGSEDHDKNIPKDNENEENTSDSIAKTGTLVLSTNKKTGKKLFEDISNDYLNYEKDPRNKVGHTVHFEVNNKVFKNKNWNNALKGYQKILRGETLNQREIDFLINHLPINAVFSASKELSKTPKSPISTLPSVKGKSQDIFDKSSKVLRTHLINHLVNGGKIEDFTTAIEGQYGGMLKVDLPDADNNVRKNNILDLYHFKGMSIKEKIAYIRKNIAIVDQQSNFEYLNGDKMPFINKKGQTKEKAKGDVYLMIPKANGVMFPLKLNIKRLDNNSQNDAIADIYEAVLKNEKLGKTSTLDELGNKELEQKIKDTFQEEKKLIGKPWNDITIGDILDFMIFDKSKSLKSRIGFLNAKNHNEFTYGDPSDGGMVINSAEEFNKVHFKNWLENNKRQHVRFKGKKKQDSKADMKSNDAYIQYLIENRVLSTNAVAKGDKEPTFQGYTNIYLDSNNVNGKIQPSTNTSQNTSAPTGVASNVPSSAFSIKPTSTSTDVRVTTNSGNITIKENGKMFYDNGNEVTEDIVKNKALVKKEQKDGTLRRSEYNGSKYAVLSDDRIISLNETSAGKEVYKNGKARDIILENAKPKKINSLSEAVPTKSNQKADIERRRQEELKDFKVGSKLHFYGSTNILEGEGTIVGETEKIFNVVYSDGRKMNLRKGQDEGLIQPNKIYGKRYTVLANENEINAKYDAELANLENKSNTYSTVENNTNNNRNSQNNFVSSHEVPNTASNAAVTALKENTKVKDKIEVSDELIKELTKFIVIEKKAIKVGSEAWKVFNNKSNQEKFDILKDIADTWNYNIDNIITKCE